MNSTTRSVSNCYAVNAHSPVNVTATTGVARGVNIEDQGTDANHYAVYQQAIGNFNALGPTAFGKQSHATNMVEIAGSLGIGSSNQSTYNSSGLSTAYNGIAQAGLGFPCPGGARACRWANVGDRHHHALSDWRRHHGLPAVATVYCTTASAAATVAHTFTYTDTSGTVQTITPSAAVCTALGSSSFDLVNTPIVAQNGTNIQYSTSIVNTPTYDVRIDLYQLGAN